MKTSFAPTCALGVERTYCLPRNPSFNAGTPILDDRQRNLVIALARYPEHAQDIADLLAPYAQRQQLDNQLSAVLEAARQTAALGCRDPNSQATIH
jgi:hypothetical protein